MHSNGAAYMIKLDHHDRAGDCITSINEAGSSIIHFDYMKGTDEGKAGWEFKKTLNTLDVPIC